MNECLTTPQHEKNKECVILLKFQNIMHISHIIYCKSVNGEYKILMNKCAF